MSNPFKFNEVLRRMEETKRNLPVIIAKQAEAHFTDSFTKGGLDENRWPEVKRRMPNEKAYNHPVKGISLNRWHSNPILVGKGELRRKVSRSISNATWSLIRLVVDLPYAKIHNEGGRTGRGGTVEIPARPFMKQTPILRRLQIETIKKEISRIWKLR